MADMTLTCESCGKKFVWTEKEQAAMESEGGVLDVQPNCKLCRPKQDDQRS